MRGVLYLEEEAVSTKNSITYLQDGEVKLELFSDLIEDSVYLECTCAKATTRIELPLEFLIKMQSDLVKFLRPTFDLLSASDAELMQKAREQARERLDCDIWRKFHPHSCKDLDCLAQELYTWMKDDQRRLRDRVPNQEARDPKA